MGFIKMVCRRLGCKERWETVEPMGKKGELLLLWGEDVNVHQIIKTDHFCMEVEFECKESE